MNTASITENNYPIVAKKVLPATEDEKVIEAKFKGALTKNGLAFEDLKYISEKDFSTSQLVGPAVMAYAVKKVREAGVSFGRYPIKYYLENKEKCQSVIDKGTKVCSRCGRELPTSAFGISRQRADGMQVWCKECKNEAERAREKDAKSNIHIPGFSEPAKDNGRPLSSFTPRELMEELAKRGYKGKLRYECIIDIENF